MNDLISRQAAIETLGEIRAEYNLWNEKERHYYEALSEAIRVLNAQNDKRYYAKIVRCKDCKYYDVFDNVDGVDFGGCARPCSALRADCWVSENWFCADGKRKEQNDEQIN